jgi:hypothetical protein
MHLLATPGRYIPRRLDAANNTRAVTFSTKGGGLTGYYSMVIPSFDL